MNNENLIHELAPFDYLKMLFNNTKNNTLIVRAFPTDENYENGTEPNKFYKCTMNWTKNDLDYLDLQCHRVYNELQANAKQFNNIQENEKIYSICKNILKDNAHPYVINRTVRVFKLFSLNTPTCVTNYETNLLFKAIVLSKYSVNKEQIK